MGMSAIDTPPRVVVEVEGRPLADADAAPLAEVRVQQGLSMPTLCELVFRDPPGPLRADRLLPGADLRVAIEGYNEPLFVGQLTAVEHVYEPDRGRQIRVRGYDVLHCLRKRQSVRAHVQLTVAELARELVADLGLSVEAEESGPLWPLLVQHRQSDLELLVDTAARCGLYAVVRDDILHLLTLAGLDETQLDPLVLGETLLESRIEVNGDPACRTVAAVGWDTQGLQVYHGEAASARSGREVAADILPQDVGGDGKRDFVDQGIVDAAQAEGIAQAELDARVAAEVTFWGVAAGNPLLRPGSAVEVDGVADDLCGRYVLTGVIHRIDQQLGYVSELTTSLPTPRARAQGAVATLGMIARVDDPDGRGRVKATLPTYADIETEWMSVVSPAAGIGKGLVALPDVGDQVLVLLLNDDPARGVVLGGLFGADGPPDDGVHSGVVKRYTLRTPGGQLVQLDDTQQTLRVTDSTGNFLELSPQRVQLQSLVDLEISAVGHAVVISGASIDFQRG